MMTTRKKITAVLATAWVLVAVSTFTTFLTNDFFVFWGWARLVDNSPSHGIAALIDNWEIKGLLSRAIYYELYKCVNLFTSDHAVAWIYTYKTVGWLQCNLLLLLAVCLLPAEYCRDAKNKPMIFFGTSAALFMAHYSAIMQPEFMSVFVMLLAIALYLRGSVSMCILAGVVFSMVFYLKTPLLLMGGTVFFAMMYIKRTSFWDELRSFLPFIVAMIAVLAASLAYLRWQHPQELEDMWYASFYQNTLLHASFSMNCLWHFTKKYMNLSLFFPLLLVAAAMLLSFVRVSIAGKDKRKLGDVALATLLLVFPMAYVIISNKYFTYHFYLFMLPSIVIVQRNADELKPLCTRRGALLLVSAIAFSLLTNNELCFSLLHHQKVQLLAVAAMMAVAAAYPKRSTVVALSVCMAVYVYTNAISAASCSTGITWKLFKESVAANVATGIKTGSMLGNGEVLFLDGGSGSYTFANHSYLRQSYPLVIQRSNERDELAKTEFHKQTTDRICSYDGEYITLDSAWFFLAPHPDIAQFINDNYTDADLAINVISFPFEIYYTKMSKGKIKVLKRRLGQ